MDQHDIRFFGWLPSPARAGAPTTDKATQAKTMDMAMARCSERQDSTFDLLCFVTYLPILKK